MGPLEKLKDRMGAFTEGILIVASPVLLAVTLHASILKSEAKGFFRVCTAPFAAASLLASLITFILLGAARSRIHVLEKVFSSLLEADTVFRVSKLAIHVCAILQLVLAYMILAVISTSRFKLVWILPLLLGIFLSVCCVLSWKRTLRQEGRAYDAGESKLEQSLEFSAAVSSLLFLALEGLALEGEPREVGPNLDGDLVFPIATTFGVGVVATLVMLFVTVPPPIAAWTKNNDPSDSLPVQGGQSTEERQRIEEERKQERSKDMAMWFNASCILLTVLFTIAVLAMIIVQVGKAEAAVVVVPWAITAVPFLLRLLPGVEFQNPAAPGPGNGGGGGEANKPASLELTKVTFAGFLAVSIANIRGHTLSGYSHAFILITAMAVVSGLLWRLASHSATPEGAAAVAADAACLFTYLCVAAAVIPFVVMAKHALDTASTETA